MPERVGLFGWPVEHSVSPPMQNAAFAALDLDWQYELLSVPPDQFAAEVARLVAAGWRGFNVTIPHKQAASNLPGISQISDAAQTIGAVNTLVVQSDGTLHADNTDWRGFLNDLARFEPDLAAHDVIVLGTGGSARGVRYALEHAGARRIVQVSRKSRPGILSYADLGTLPAGNYVIVNCTPVGMHPQVDASPWPADVPFPARTTLVYDLVYNPDTTRLMQQATAAGIPTVNGLGMLVEQGALAFEQWTGSSPARDVMHTAARAALGLDN